MSQPTASDSGKKWRGFVIRWVLLLGFLWLVLEWTFLYHWPGYSYARTPSLKLELLQVAGFEKYYSQYGQDKWIIDCVFPGVRNGYFVDVGAYDAEHGSNSKALEVLGWTGVCVEPFPVNWKNRTAILYEEVLSSKKGETIEFRRAKDMSGIDNMMLDSLRDQLMDREVVKLTTTTIADILERVKAPEFIHYISIDVEGAEYEILKAFPFDKYKVGAWTIEHNRQEPKRTNIRKLLESNGYRFDRTQVIDDWYVGPRPPK